ncbi:Storkhead-box protein 1 [Frankliniella fusca]|uniref:Storkhead-box protein 1 n=1 Tax=Frankliniella fusca TaxID=407009 RepID=A0AAE1I1K4_9NEOP|nr:Storkhead-box protein 1 [Frankliniella fusca]
MCRSMSLVAGDVEECCVLGVAQSQFTPLPEALCWVILELTSTGQAAVLPAILRALPRAFPAMTRPDSGLVYDALAKLSTDRKVYQTARGYFLVTPETRRRLASLQHHGAGARTGRGRRSMLLSNEEAIVMVHGDMQTERDGHRTHQCVQTNLADVICGGNPEDKVLYPRVDRLRSGEPGAGAGGRTLERRHSLRLSTRLGQALQRAGSLRSLPPRPPPRPPPADSPAPAPASGTAGTAGPEKKQSLLSRLFRRSGRSGRAGNRSRGRRGQSAPPAPGSSQPHPPPHPPRSPSPNIRTFSAQFPVQDDDDAERPPADWFNPGVTALTSVGTQTQPPSPSSSPSVTPPPRSASSPAVSRWDGAGRASTLPRSLSRGSPRRARRLSDSLSVSLLSAGGADLHHHHHHLHHLRAASPASHASHASRTSHASHAPTMSSVAAASPSPSPSPTKIPSGSKLLVPAARKTSPSNTLLSTTSSRASRASASTSGMSKASSGYNSSRSAPGSAPGTRSGSPARRSLPVPGKTPSCTSAPTSTGSVISARNSTTTTTATINGSNTKIFVQQHNSPVRSVITIENRSGGGGSLAATLGTTLGSGRSRPRGPVLETSFDRVVPKSSESGGEGAGGSPSESGSGAAPPAQPGPGTEADRYSSNKINNHNLSGKTAASSSSSSTSSTSSEESLTSAGSLVAKEAEMNNSRRQSAVAAPVGFLRESLSYKNILKEVQNLSGAPAPLPQPLPQPLSASPYASLSDLSVHCKSLAAQRILSGVSINSIDTLVEVNMAAEKKQANCDVTIRTDFGMV